jgi:hypothetical protein
MTNRVKLTTEELARFRREGYLAIDRPLVAADDLAVVRHLFDELFDHFDNLPRDLAYDLGDVQHHEGPRQIPEINDALKLEARLGDTRAFARCMDLARQFLGGRVHCYFDHAVCKPPHNDAATEWHQDLAYSPNLAGRDAVHIWLALQDVSPANGCMHFVPDGGRGLLPHRRRGESSMSHALVAEGFDSSTAVACPLGAGMATVHGLTTLHYTPPNTTDEPRLAWVLHFHAYRPPPWRVRIRKALSRAKRVLGRGPRRSS